MSKRTHASPLLIGESFSPWTKKARWALEQCGCAYDYKEYTPTLSEPGLRWRLRQCSGKVTVPVLLAGKEIIRGSWQIARFANRADSTGRLGNFAKTEPWNNLSEAALAEGRTRVVRCILGSDAALEESLPGFVPGFLRGSLRFVARNAVQRLDRKYAHLATADALLHALEKTRERLAQDDSDFLLGSFSYADIAMAVVLEVVAPIAFTNPPLGPATQNCWNQPELAREFEDLIAWRNRLAAADATSYSQFKARRPLSRG